MQGRHATSSAGSRRLLAGLLGLATVLGVWLGAGAPAVSPVTPPTAAVQVQPVDDGSGSAGHQHGGGR